MKFSSKRTISRLVALAVLATSVFSNVMVANADDADLLISANDVASAEATSAQVILTNDLYNSIGGTGITFPSSGAAMVQLGNGVYAHNTMRSEFGWKQGTYTFLNEDGAVVYEATEENDHEFQLGNGNEAMDTSTEVGHVTAMAGVEKFLRITVDEETDITLYAGIGSTGKTEVPLVLYSYTAAGLTVVDSGSLTQPSGTAGEEGFHDTTCPTLHAPEAGTYVLIQPGKVSSLNVYAIVIGSTDTAVVTTEETTTEETTEATTEETTEATTEAEESSTEATTEEPTTEAEESSTEEPTTEATTAAPAPVEPDTEVTTEEPTTEATTEEPTTEATTEVTEATTAAAIGWVADTDPNLEEQGANKTYAAGDVLYTDDNVDVVIGAGGATSGDDLDQDPFTGEVTADNGRYIRVTDNDESKEASKVKVSTAKYVDSTKTSSDVRVIFTATSKVDGNLVVTFKANSSKQYAVFDAATLDAVYYVNVTETTDDCVISVPVKEGQSLSFGGIGSSQWTYSVGVTTDEAPESTLACSKVWGDANGDGSVTAEDAAIVVQYILNGTGLDDTSVVDVNQDGTIDTVDATMILQNALDGSYTLPTTIPNVVESGSAIESGSAVVVEN